MQSVLYNQIYAHMYIKDHWPLCLYVTLRPLTWYSSVYSLKLYYLLDYRNFVFLKRWFLFPELLYSIIDDMILSWLLSFDSCYFWILTQNHFKVKEHLFLLCYGIITFTVVQFNQNRKQLNHSGQLMIYVSLFFVLLARSERQKNSAWSLTFSM